jgi:hypothetical protein
MEVHIYISTSHPSLRAFTSDSTGGNLPPEYAPWRIVDCGRLTIIGAPIDPIAIAVQRDGFYLVNTQEQAQVVCPKATAAMRAPQIFRWFTRLVRSG